DFSASINPLGPSPRARQAIRTAMTDVVHYPDPDCVELRESLASRLGVPPDLIAIGNGSSELIHLLPAALSLRHAMILGPTFSDYARAVTLARGRVTFLHASRDSGYRPPVGETLARLRAPASESDSVVLCHPNSPTGQVATPEEMHDLIETCQERGLWLIVDESFVDYCEDRSVLPAIAAHPRLVVLRSFTKFYALTGLRVGYLVVHPDVVAKVRQWQSSWSVNTLAQVGACAALQDQSHARRSLALIRKERERLKDDLECLPGLKVFPSVANFLLVELPVPILAGEVRAALRGQGLLVRDCSAIPGLTPYTLRVAIRRSGHNNCLVRALKQRLGCSRR
ncbi:MAG: threonine-phosphate decarboxylase CobD, partial [Nitrospirales bacterium]